MLMDAGDCANAPVKARAAKPTAKPNKRSDIFIINAKSPATVPHWRHDGLTEFLVSEVFVFIKETFLFPDGLIFGNCGSGRDEEPQRGEVLRLIQIRVATLSLEKSCQFVKIIRTERVSQIQVPKTQSAFIRPHNETL